jgi:phosphate transport system permease protein
LLNIAGAGLASFSVTMLLFGRLAPFSGLVAFVVVAYVLFIALYAVLVSLSEDEQGVRDRLMTAIMVSAASLTASALVFIVLFIVYRGRQALAHLNFFTQDLSRAASQQPLTVGGIKHAIVGTLWMISIALVLTVPLGLVAAVYLNEVGGRFARFVRTIVEAMTALPSIVAGLFIYATWILALHQEKSALAGSLALSVDMLPIIIRAADVVLRLVPGGLREASAALGAPQWRTVRTVVLPTARSGLATSVILGMARAIGETAPVLLTVGYGTALNTNPLHGPMVNLPLAAFELVKTGEPTQVARGFAAASFLLLLVLTLFVIARVIGGRGPGNLTKGQARRIRRASARDANRIITSYGRSDGLSAHQTVQGGAAS